MIKRHILGALALAGLLLPGAALAMSVNYPAGTQIFGTLRSELSTKTAYNGEPFTMVTDGGSVVRGHVSEVVKASLSHKAHIKLNFDSIRFPDGTSAPLAAVVTDVQQKSQYNIAQAAGSLIAGNIAGNMLGHAVGVKGIGGLGGLAAGALYAQNTARDLDIPANSRVGIKLTEPLVTRPQAR